MKTPGRILVVSSSWLGDTVLSLPAVHGIKHIDSDTFVAALAKPLPAEILQAVPDIDETILFDTARTLLLRNIIRTAAAVRRRRFDLALFFPRSCAAALVCALARIPRRVGFSAGIRNMLMTDTVPLHGTAAPVHEAERYKKLAAHIGASRFPEKPSFTVPREARSWADEFLNRNDKKNGVPRVCLNPGSTNGDAKRWMPERFTELARRLHSCEIVLVGDSSSAPLTRGINSSLGGTARDAAGATSISRLAALLAACDVLVTNDTGPMHLACAVGTPVVAVLGPTDEAVTGPLGTAVVIRKRVSCGPCRQHTCPEGTHRCMQLVAVDEVEEAVLKQLETLHPLGREGGRTGRYTT